MTPCCKSLTNLTHNVVLSIPHITRIQITTLVVIGTDCIGSCKSNCDMITTTTAPIFSIILLLRIVKPLLVIIHTLLLLWIMTRKSTRYLWLDTIKKVWIMTRKSTRFLWLDTINQRLSRACIVHLVIKKTNWSYVKTMSVIIHTLLLCQSQRNLVDFLVIIHTLLLCQVKEIWLTFFCVEVYVTVISMT
jgi:hypothetical protein